MKAYRKAFAIARATTALVVVATLVPGRASAQAAGGNTTINSTNAGYLGILKLRCNCTMRVDSDDRFRFFSFRSDPVIGSIESGSPADGVLKIGDAITHIDGISIRSNEGGRKFANIQPGQNVELTVSRNSASSRVRLRASGISWDDSRVLGTVAPEAPWAPGAGYTAVWQTPPTTPRPARTPRAAPQVPPAEPGVPVAPAPPGAWSDVTPGVAQAAPPVAVITPAPGVPGTVSASSVIVPSSPVSPSGWFGFSFRCNNCGWARPGGNGDPVWEPGDSPAELTMIARGGPADRAGLKVGDRMTHIDGVRISTREGSRKLGAVKPGQRVRVTVLRDGKPFNTSLVLGERPESRAVAAARRPGPPAPPLARRELRYTGRLEDVSVEVWSSAGSTVERVGDTMVITVGTSVIRLKLDPKK